uniref:Uncharacterized protein n=1 Tax=Chlamydomonas leiostraca TaxID=1034604 RepID=A0A7S0S0X0_9CHLO|mmetsp:Transcript_35034/g.88715  ORF Transcript_35034/g.88715 Transcript_35034/m.88715 type:complete len:347 (+) Transcript_35034:105-1145(+)
MLLRSLPSSTCTARRANVRSNVIRVCKVTGPANVPSSSLRKSQPRRIAVVAASGSGSSPSTTTSPDALRSQLKALEHERDEAIATAESCARAGVKLADMVRLLEELALEKVKSGDESGARQALAEKASAKEALEKNSTKSQANFELAQKLAAAIGQKQAALLAALRAATSATTTSSAAPNQPTQDPRPAGSQSAGTGASYSSSTYSSGSSYGSTSGFSNDATATGGPAWRWQQSLAEAKERVRKQEATAQQLGRAARLSAEESIASARERLKAQTEASLSEAQQRIREAAAGSGSSIEAAQERLKQRDEEVLAYVRRVMGRYRRGEYVSEEELEFAFKQLEQRFLL